MGSIKWDDAALGDAIGADPDVLAAVSKATDSISEKANSMSAGYRTGIYHRDHKSPGVGNTQPKYGKDARIMGKSAVGIVYTGNYAAMKDNHENNTLLKARG